MQSNNVKAKHLFENQNSNQSAIAPLYINSILNQVKTIENLSK